jgi:hypothetical protein
MVGAAVSPEEESPESRGIADIAVIGKAKPYR